jgi:cytochrome b pre-mRNA-processing protein 3
MVLGLFKRRRHMAQIEPLYDAIVAAARRPQLYLQLGVADSVMGRFEVLSLHVALVLRRLKALPAPAADVAQDVVDRFFADLDASMREIGIGDTSVPKKIKQMGDAFYGRAAAYDAALAPAAPEQALSEALARNVLGRGADATSEALATEVRRLVDRLDGMGLDALLAGQSLVWPAPGPA